ncbi:MAG: class I tRNA ligase family protein, partial [Verrucomicrobia bacterium]|nr:class I tRNA ligase family protein [Verrucomicrobiota bacterium]
NGCGEGTINFKLRDWLFSRQRYWGEPFPIVYDAEGRAHTIPDSMLPLELPPTDSFSPRTFDADDAMSNPESPLDRLDWWADVDLDLGAGDGVQRYRRDTNVMPQWAGSCWYYLRFCDPDNEQAPCGAAAEKYWLSGGGVDLYVGGAEHAVLHLLYARFWHKVLFDLGLVSHPEPFRRLVNQGIILGEDNRKMSKSVGNVVNPDEVIQEHGADALRVFEMFMGPLEQMKPWSAKGMEGSVRFLARVWRLVNEETETGDWIPSSTLTEDAPDEETVRALAKTTAKVGGDIEGLQFNTAISALMILVNHLTGLPRRPKSVLRQLARLLAPFAPHLAEEIHLRLGGQGLASLASWPTYRPEDLQEESVELPVQINSRLKGRLRVPAKATREEVEALIRQHPELENWTGGKKIQKLILVPGRIVNLICP